MEPHIEFIGTLQKSGFGLAKVAVAQMLQVDGGVGCHELELPRACGALLSQQAEGSDIMPPSSRHSRSQSCGRSKKQHTKLWTLLFLWCRLQSPKVDVLFGSAQGSRLRSNAKATGPVTSVVCSEASKAPFSERRPLRRLASACGSAARSSTIDYRNHDFCRFRVQSLMCKL